MSRQNGNANIVELTGDVVIAYLSHNTIDPAALPLAIRSVYDAFKGLGEAVTVVAERPEPAVPVRGSVKPDYLVCLEDGAKVKMLKRDLRTRFNLSPDEYRARWELPASYPMTAPNYTTLRRSIAQQTGLGRAKASASDTTVVVPEEASG